MNQPRTSCNVCLHVAALLLLLLHACMHILLQTVAGDCGCLQPTPQGHVNEQAAQLTGCS